MITHPMPPLFEEHTLDELKGAMWDVNEDLTEAIRGRMNSEVVQILTYRLIEIEQAISIRIPYHPGYVEQSTILLGPTVIFKEGQDLRAIFTDLCEKEECPIHFARYHSYSIREFDEGRSAVTIRGCCPNFRRHFAEKIRSRILEI